MLALLLMLQSEPPAIVVTGERLVAAQAECARLGCTPLRDAQATIALAEIQFRAGEYLDAKRLLEGAIRRNKGKGAEAPRPVAALYEAYATVSLHEGDQKAYRQAVAKQVEILKTNLPPDDPAVTAAATALGDMWLKLGYYRQALATFSAIEGQAWAAGQEQTGMMAGMKQAWILTAVDRERDALDKLAALEARPKARDPAFQTALRVLRLRIKARDVDANSSDMTALIREIGENQSAEPILIASPAYDEDHRASANALSRALTGRDAIPLTSSDLSGIRWADIGFWIRPDGQTADIEILRGSRDKGWLQAALKQIAGRRYASSSDKGDGFYRIERYTMRSAYQAPIGSHIARRAPIGGYEVINLTQEPADPPS